MNATEIFFTFRHDESQQMLGSCNNAQSPWRGQGTWPETLPLAPTPALLCAGVWHRGGRQGEGPLGVAQTEERLAEACLFTKPSCPQHVEHGHAEGYYHYSNTT